MEILFDRVKDYIMQTANKIILIGFIRLYYIYNTQGIFSNSPTLVALVVKIDLIIEYQLIDLVYHRIA